MIFFKKQLKKCKFCELMIRDISKITDKDYDLIVIGGGIFGVCAAWDATLRGLTVAIIEKGDFSHATSSNHFKMVHGGIRYLQHGDFVRIRESSRERSSLLRIAPHLIKPLPIVIPTYGHGLKGKAILGTGMYLYDILTCDRNRRLNRDRHIPWSHFISREEVQKLYPGIRDEGLTGAAVFYDAQMYNPPRIVLSFLRAAVEYGAAAANYLEVTNFLRAGNRIVGVQAYDGINNSVLEIKGRCVLNAAGPWAHKLLESSLDLRLPKRPTFSRDLALVVNRSSLHDYAVAFSTSSKDTDTIIDRGGRHLFAVPWREQTLIGVWHKFYTGHPDEIAVEPKEIESYVTEVNQAYPGLKLHSSEINLINTGLTLFGEEDCQGAESMSFGKRSMLIDHETINGFKRLITLIGVRATTARGMAAKAIDLVIQKLGKPAKKADTQNIPIYGGDIGSFDKAVHLLQKQYDHILNFNQARHLVSNYGNRCGEVMKYVEADSSLADTVGESYTLKAEIRHAVQEEMAVHLTDIVFRRTDIATGQMPRTTELEMCASLVADELGWDQPIIDKEIESVGKSFNTTALKPN